MEPLPSPALPEPYQPTEAQLMRAAARRRFNRWVIYLPISLFALIGLGLFVFMLVNALPDEGSQRSREFLSGLADIILIGALIPLWLAATMVPVGFIALIVQLRRKDMRPLRGLQILLWRIETKLGQLQQKTNELAPKAAAPIINAHARAAFAWGWLNKVGSYFRRARSGRLETRE
ncbi:MAG: hypothetical protein KJ063_20135 [Anaerolineae bacterium]|nr:hypothetical protein [Anaerolineae bacterium]